MVVESELAKVEVEVLYGKAIHVGQAMKSWKNGSDLLLVHIIEPTA